MIRSHAILVPYHIPLGGGGGAMDGGGGDLTLRPVNWSYVPNASQGFQNNFQIDAMNNLQKSMSGDTILG